MLASVSSDDIRLVVVYGVLPLVGGIGTFFVKSVLTRLNMLERELPAKPSEQEVRQLMLDKLEPLRDDVKDLNNKIERIIEILIDKK